MLFSFFSHVNALNPFLSDSSCLAKVKTITTSYTFNDKEVVDLLKAPVMKEKEEVQDHCVAYVLVPLSGICLLIAFALEIVRFVATISLTMALSPIVAMVTFCR